MGEGEKEDGIFSTGEKTSGSNYVYLVARLNYLPRKEMDTVELGSIMEKIKLHFVLQSL